MHYKPKSDLILMHGAAGSSKQFDDLAKSLTDNFNVHKYDMFGHGGRETGSSDFTIALFSNELIEFINENKIPTPVNLFGYSMGGYVALYTAMKQPDLFNRIFTIATKFNWNSEIASKEAAMLDPEKIVAKVPHFASYLDRLHQPADWKVLLKEIAKMLIRLGENPPLNASSFSQIKTEVLITVGSADKMVSIEESKMAANLIPNATCKVFDSVEHPLEKIPVSLLANEIIKYFS